MSLLAGIDIGGTKCAASIGQAIGDSIEIIDRRSFPTEGTPAQVIRGLIDILDAQLKQHKFDSVSAIGISCGGPLSSKEGILFSPPNLPGWDQIDIVAPFRNRFSVPTALQNDANACALAEWQWGAGKGTKNMVFLTFGTGMGAGLILDGRLYAGTNDMAGEIGHVRMEAAGPVGYGKAGSFEGFCSGGGIAQLAQTMARERLLSGGKPSFCPSLEMMESITAQKVGEAARQGDPLAQEIFEFVGVRLGRGLAILVDILNPERIVIGSIYGRQQSLLEPIALKELAKESLPLSLSVCQVVPAGLGDQVGDYASLAVAMEAIKALRH